MVFLIFFFLIHASCSKKIEQQTALRVGLESNPTNLDPRFATDATSSRLGQLIFSSLVKLDSHAMPVGDLAERWEVVNGKKYVFYLRHGVKFHDGRELTAHDVKGTFLSVMDNATSSPYKKAYSDIIKDIEVGDKYTVTFNLKRAHAPFLVDMVFPIIPSSPSVADDFQSTLIGSGPFKFEKFVMDEYIELSANKDYYASPPNVERIKFRIIPENNVRVLEIKKGSLDFIQNDITPDLLPLLEKDPTLTIIKGSGTNYTYIGFNLKDDVLSNKNLRKAIAHGIDINLIIQEVLKGQAVQAKGLLASSNWAHNPDVMLYEHDPAKAKQLLDEAGYTDPDGNGPLPRLKLTFKTSQNELANRVAEVLQAQLKNIGIEITISRYEWGTFYDFIKKGDFQIYTLTWVGISEPDMYYNVFHSSSIPPNGANRGRFENERLDKLLSSARETADTDKRKQIYFEVQQIAAEELPYISLWHPINVAVMKNNIKQFELYPSGSLLSFKDIRITQGTN